MAIPMPAVVVLIVCKTVVVGPEDPNTAYTGYENRAWATEYSKMVCRRQEVQLFDQAEALGAAARPFNMQRCWRSGLMLGVQWDASHKGSSYRFWRVACPVPIVRKNPDGSEDIIAWKMPECGHRDTVRCEIDTEI
ncbi:MAG: hypothetical protein V3S93_02180 [Methyloceanibacter sp.]|jgi:hypothetical protein